MSKKLLKATMASCAEDVMNSPRKRPKLEDERAGDVKTTAVESGVEVKKVSYQWTVRNFELIRTENELMKKQSFEFQVTDKLGALTSWLINLRTFVDPIDKAEWLSLRRQLVKSSPPPVTTPNMRQSNSRSRTVAPVDPICNILTITVNDKNGKCFLKSGGKTSFTKTNAFGFTKLFRKSEKAENLPLINGSLVINIDLEIITSVTTVYEPKKYFFDVQAFEKESRNKIYNLIATLEGDTTNSDVKIVSNDEKEFPVHRFVLSATSPVFEAMFRSIMTETETGVVKCEDLSGKCLKILVHYIYTGTLLEEWCHSDILYELTYAADKYLLTDLLQFLDGVLGKVCTPMGIGSLLSLVNSLSLKKAAKDIREYIRNCATNSPEELFNGGV